MANIVLPQVDILSTTDNNTNIMIEQNGEIKRVNISNIKTEANNVKMPTTFNSFPSEAEIQALPNNSFFIVKAFGQVDAENKIATYYRTTSWTRNALRFKESNGTTTIYVVPVDQSMNEVYLPYYGIKTGKENAENNSAIMNTLISTIQYGATFKIPSGHFYFSEPIDVSGKHISIIGTAAAGYKHINISGTTFLHFVNLPEGAIALKVAQATIANFTVYGDESQYNMQVNRDESSDVPNPSVEETCTAKTYGIFCSGSMIIHNIGVRNFYYGTWCETANMAITNVTYHRCHYGLSIGNDIKCFNVFGFDNMILLQMRGSLSSVTGLRGDSCGEHLVEITHGGSFTLTDLDADFCMGSIVSIGDGKSASEISGLNINGIHGRYGVNHVFSTLDEEITANNISTGKAHEYGLISIETGSSLKGAIIITNQNLTNPYDTKSGYAIPYILLSADSNTTVQDIQIFASAYNDENIESWCQKRVSSLSTLSKACDVKIYLTNGFVKYIKNNGAVSIINDASDIQKRMDLSSYAKNIDTVKSVNGIQPDDEGNVTVEFTEQEPEIVSKLEECVDISKKYVLPDGYIYAYRKKFIAGGTYPNFVNQLPISLNPLNPNEILDGVGYKYGVTYNVDSTNKTFTEAEYTRSYTSYCTGLIPVENNDIVRINNLGFHSGEGAGYPFCRYTRTDLSGTGHLFGGNLNTITDGGGKYTLTGQYDKAKLGDVEIHLNNSTCGWVTQYGNLKYIWFILVDSIPPEDVIITVNQEITYTTIEDHYEWSWENTGELYVKPDYLGMISDLENRIKMLEEKIN